MRKLSLIAAAVAVAFSAGGAMAGGADVTFIMKGQQLSARNAKLNDTFSVTLDDAQVKTTLAIECSAGGSSWGGFIRNDEACGISGNGVIKNPNNPSQTIPRTQYRGGYTIQAKQDGYTPANTMSVNYLAAGNVPPSTATFGGSMVMMPENPAAGAMELFGKLKSQLEQQATGTGGIQIVEDMDVITFNGFATPSAGFPSDAGCVWNGDMIYAYANDSWAIDLSATCGGQTYQLKGNMPWIDVDDTTATYTLNLAKPSAGGSATDNALFAAPASGGMDLFAAVDGVKATFTIKMTDVVEVKVGDTTEEVPVNVDATADFVGTGVPLELVRSLAQVFAINSRALFGA